MGRQQFDEIVDIKIPSSTRHLHTMRTLTRILAESMGFDRKDSEGAALAVEEALTNVIEHSYHGEEHRKMHIIFELDEEKFTVRILHNGDQIEISNLSRSDDWTTFHSQKKKGGLGILLMKKCMDEVTYKAGARQNECCMVKYLRKER